MPGLMPKKWRWKWAAASLLIAAVVAVLYFRFDEPLRRCFNGVRAGVTLQGEPVERLFRHEVEAIIDRMARQQGREPVNAEIDPVNERIIPELNGLEVDREATLELVMKAPSGMKLMPVYRELLPEVRWDHYPALPAAQGNPRKPCVSLMINVAWGEEELPEMLNVLQKEGARATFFLTGRWAEKNEALVRQIAAAGHELGNHGYADDEVFPELEPWGMASSISRTNEIIFDAVGSYPRYFTPHKGEFNKLTLEIVSRQGMRTLLWSLDTVDWKKPGVDLMREKITHNLAPGQIILMHPTADTVQLLREILPWIKEEGLAVVSAAELLDPGWQQ
ncbi:MAG TPA: polysaccharide deacetylase family protein [Bacillota bacterium]|jgi:probable sporulation protein (polysaccharide deacetylase family)|nr:polysaccharide deacetylase family protein [Bacillota bacterium]HOL14686.1 polysaccharide deacetylase family protein [Bacillota bacterium]HPZ11097.1 polysaccharide deacetylase family protein [Bacillota bacterium]